MIQLTPTPHGQPFTLADVSVTTDVKIPTLGRVVDGDTWWLYVEGLFRQLHYIEFRLEGWDTPEKQGSLTTLYERSQAQVARLYAVDWFHRPEPIQIQVYGSDPEKYGRWRGRPFTATSDLGQELADRKLASEYHGTGKRWRDYYGTP